MFEEGSCEWFLKCLWIDDFKNLNMWVMFGKNLIEVMNGGNVLSFFCLKLEFVVVCEMKDSFMIRYFIIVVVVRLGFF